LIHMSAAAPSSDYRADKIFDLSGKIALVTGGGTGIGLMIARGLAANNAKVYITGRRMDVIEKAAAAWDGQGGAIIPIVMDVTDRESIFQVRYTIQKEEGVLHILVNNAGQVGPITDTTAPKYQDAETLGNALFNESPDAWADLYSVNTFSIFYVTSIFLGLLDKGSRQTPGYTSSVINIASISGITKLAQRHFAYNSAKAAASHLTKLFATELALKKIPIRVNAIAPGVFESEMTSERIADGDGDKVGGGTAPVPAARSGLVSEMAGTAIYLASPAGCYTNGQVIVVDGGYLAVNPSTA